MPDERLPIKVVHQRNEDLQKPDAGGGPRKIFGEVTPAVRRRLVQQVRAVEATFQPVFERAPNIPAVARLRLKEDAIAKSHRPASLLSVTTPIIGVETFGELLLSVRPAGLRALVEQFESGSTKQRLADISTIDTIQPYGEEDALRATVETLIHAVKDDGALKLRLFNHGNTALNAIVFAAFLRQLKALDMAPPEELPYGGDVRIFRLNDMKPEAVEPLARFVGTQSLSRFPKFRSLDSASMAVRALTPLDLPPPEEDRAYPVVGVIDSGVDPGDSFLAPWVIERHEYVPPRYRSYDHGSFVAGLIAQPRLLNQGDPRFPDASARVVDVVAIPGGHEGVREDDLLTILEDVVPAHPDVRVWNLSLASDEPCDDRSFSDLAIKLDDLQDRYDVTFVLAAGNYQTAPFRGWPPEDLGNADRICSPADSLRSLTVGSVAHLDRPNSRVRSGQPSPFSRRGPGPVFTPKPEVVHLGGNCDDTGQYLQTGVMSVDGSGRLAENIGTSFAAPLVSTLMANVDAALAVHPSRNLLKALLVHSAMLGMDDVTANELRYRGFGVPSDPMNVLTCTPWSATLVFEAEIAEGVEFIRSPFPIPPSLRTKGGKVRGDVVMTLVYDPPLNATFGAEYCRTNVEASLGTYDVGKDGKRHHRRQIPPEPQDMAKMFERQLIEHGFKWSPVKVYRRSMDRVTGKDWRLVVGLTQRSGFATSDAQRAAIVITLADPGESAPVYDEVVIAMTRLGWTTNDLEIQARLRT